MSKKDKHSKTEDAALFRSAIGPVKPVTGRRDARNPPQPKPHTRLSREDARVELEESLTDGADLAELEVGDKLLFARANISRKVIRQLRRGQYDIQDEIDLHGMTLNEARPALKEFISEALARRLHCVRIVHGKGLGCGPRGPVLKNALNRWLRQWDFVAAFCSAQTNDGGTGAVYVLFYK